MPHEAFLGPAESQKTEIVLHCSAGSSTLHFNFNLLGQTSIVGAKANQNFLATEVVNNRSAVGQEPCAAWFRKG